MKISKKLLQKIIREEINSVVYGEDMIRKIVPIFAEAIQNMDEKQLYKDLKSIGVIPQKAVYMLKQGELASNFIRNACELHNGMIREYGGGETITIDAFMNFPASLQEPHKGQDPFTFRNRRSPQSLEDREDLRANRKV